MYVPRTLEPAVTRAAQQFPVVLLTGARQVGKTTLLKQLSQGARTYVTLDDPLVLSLAKADPALFMSASRRPCLSTKSSTRRSCCRTSKWPRIAPDSRACSGSRDHSSFT